MQEHWAKCFYLVNKVSKEMHRNIKKYWWKMHLEPSKSVDHVSLQLVQGV